MRVSRTFHQIKLKLYRVYPYVSTAALFLLVAFDVTHRLTPIKRERNEAGSINARSSTTGSGTGSNKRNESEWINGKIGKQQIEYKLFLDRQDS